MNDECDTEFTLAVTSFISGAFYQIQFLVIFFLEIFGTFGCLTFWPLATDLLPSVSTKKEIQYNKKVIKAAVHNL